MILGFMMVVEVFKVCRLLCFEKAKVCRLKSYWGLVIETFVGGYFCSRYIKDLGCFDRVWDE